MANRIAMKAWKTSNGTLTLVLSLVALIILFWVIFIMIDDVGKVATAQSSPNNHSVFLPLVARTQPFLLYDDLPSGSNGFTSGPLRDNLIITYYLENGTGDIDGTEERDAIKQAFDIWETVPDVGFNFVEVTNAASVDIVMSFGMRGHVHENPFNGQYGFLAYAFAYYQHGDEIYSSDIHFDEAETWTVGTRDENVQPIDLVTVAAHEIGHSLGLYHSDVTSSLMFPKYTGSHRFLAQDDLDRIRSLYSYIAATAEPTPTFTPTDTPTNTPIPTSTPTNTLVPVVQDTYTPRPTYTPNPTYTPRPTAIYTPSPTAINTPTPTETPDLEATNESNEDGVATRIAATLTARPNYTPPPTSTPTPTATNIPPLPTLISTLRPPTPTSTPTPIQAADLIVENLTVTSYTTDTISYEYTIANIGTAPANLDGPTDADWDNVSVQAFLSDDRVFGNEGDFPVGGTTLGVSPLGYLYPNEEFTGGFTASVNNPDNWSYLTLKVDWSEVIDESNESNNTIAKGFGFGDGSGE